MAGPEGRRMFRFIKKLPFSKVIIPVYVLTNNARKFPLLRSSSSDAGMVFILAMLVVGSWYLVRFQFAFP